VGFQEAFVEYKLHDLSAQLDLFFRGAGGDSGINADFRGFSVCGRSSRDLRVFGDLKKRSP